MNLSFANNKNLGKGTISQHWHILFTIGTYLINQHHISVIEFYNFYTFRKMLGIMKKYYVGIRLKNNTI